MSQAGPRVRRRPGPRRTLSESEILDVALGVLDAGGRDALSMRTLATALEVAPNALYTYFPTKAALLRALTDHLLARVDRSVLARADLAWHARVITYALDLRAELLRHPGTATLLLTLPFDGPEALALGEDLLGVLAASGLESAEAARLNYVLITYVLGTVALDAAETTAEGVRPGEDERTAARRAALDVPADTYPRTAAAADVIAAYNSTAQFRWGLERWLCASRS